MKKFFIIAVSALSLTACSIGPKTGQDGFKFTNKEFTMNDVNVKIVTYTSQEELEAVAYRHKIKNTGATVAFTDLHPPLYNSCTIHMIDPAIKYQPEILGHEFMHCVYGKWHSQSTGHN